MKRNLVVFFDSGDTIVDESTEIRDQRGIVTHAELHDGGKELLQYLYDNGFTLALVADGEVESFKNVYEEHGIPHVFSARAISEALPDRKPAAIMFQTAMDALGLTDADKHRVVMIGNNLIRDVVGANRYGITSILYDWSPRYDMKPKNQEETPDYTVSTKDQLIALLERLDSEVSK
ncbi:MAG: HAD family hydrolase [Treponemataceae bacterium]|nr:HAD family hydrolase [Treponemataceae bacterium]